MKMLSFVFIKVNTKGIQALVGSIIVAILFICVFCNSDSFSSFWYLFCAKETKVEEKSAKSASTSAADGKIKRNREEIIRRRFLIRRESSVMVQSCCIQFKDFLKKIFFFFYRTLKSKACFLILLTISTVLLQIAFAHDLFGRRVFGQYRHHGQIKDVCTFLTNYYMTEDLIYFPLSLLFCGYLYLTQRTRRFNQYIMKKFQTYFRSELYSEVFEDQKQAWLEQFDKNNSKNANTESKCLKISKRLFISVPKRIYDMFCCLFCCSCCVPQNSNFRCFICYCCCLGWRQTDLYKFLKCVQNFFYYLFCCPCFIALYKCITKPKNEDQDEANDENVNEIKAEESENQRVFCCCTKKNLNKIQNDWEVEENTDFEDFSHKEQKLHNQYLLSCSPFSTNNRFLSGAVYVIYTYDVLNIFMSIYTSSLAPVPIFGDYLTSGVLVNILIQLIQVLMIGVKFYPILIVSDAEPSIINYLLASFYLFFIWLIRFFRKSFCSRTDAFVSLTIKMLKTQFNNSVINSFNVRYNITNSILGLFSDNENPTKVYVEKIVDKVPKVFNEYFGKYILNDDTGDYLYDATDDDQIPNNLIYQSTYNYYPGLVGDQLDTTRSPFETTTSTRASLRSFFKNQTMEKISSVKDKFYQRDRKFENYISLLENLPLYITLSYLLWRYCLLFISTIALKYKQMKASRHIKSNETYKSSEYFNKLLEEINRDQIEIDEISNRKRRKKNKNFAYIKQLMNNFNLYPTIVTEKSSKKPIKSWALGFMEQTIFKIYKPVPYMRYSKQFVNTFTIAFMVIYFFTIFGVRLANIFGDAFLSTIQLIYKVIVKYVLPTASSIDLEEYNFDYEFRTACFLTSLITIVQLFLCIKNFHKDLLRLHRGEKFFRSVVEKYSEKSKKERDKQSSKIATDSIHFPGYLIAHLVYGYFVLFMGMFIILMFMKLFFLVRGIVPAVIQLLLPIVILFAFKFLIIEFLVKSVFLRNDKRITNLAPYFMLSYFNFFFDCFLGLVACLSRVWQTTIISLISLPRLDKTIFNSENDVLLRRMDKGYLAYLNYVRMEHWYNNPVLNGFCEMLLESMFYSQIRKKKFLATIDSEAKLEPEETNDQEILTKPGELARSASQTSRFKLSIIRTISESKQHNKRDFRVTEKVIDLPITPIQASPFYNDIINLRLNSYSMKIDSKFNYQKFLRLRNIICLCLLLRKKPELKEYRYHRIKELRSLKSRKEEKQSFADFFKIKKEKYLGKVLGNFSAISSLKLNQSTIFRQRTGRSSIYEDELSNDTENITNETKLSPSNHTFLQSIPSMSYRHSVIQGQEPQTRIGQTHGAAHKRNLSF